MGNSHLSFLFIPKLGGIKLITDETGQRKPQPEIHIERAGDRMETVFPAEPQKG